MGQQDTDVEVLTSRRAHPIHICDEGLHVCGAGQRREERCVETCGAAEGRLEVDVDRVRDDGGNMVQESWNLSSQG